MFFSLLSKKPWGLVISVCCLVKYLTPTSDPLSEHSGQQLRASKGAYQQ